MEIEYFNYSTQIGTTWWERDGFIRKWHKMGAADRRWTPPDWATLRYLRHLPRVPALTKLSPQLIYVEAMSRPAGKRHNEFGADIFEKTVASTILLQDFSRRTAYLSWLHVVNSEEPLDYLLGAVMENLWGTGIQRLILSTGLTPLLGSGVLLDHYHLDPPLHTPYNPPYYPELLQTSVKQTATSCLYTLDVTTAGNTVSKSSGPADIVPFTPRSLAKRYLDLFRAASTDPAFPELTYDDADLLIGQLGLWPLYGLLARINRQPVGFILLQADGAQAQRTSNGGRNPLWRAWLHWRKQQPCDAGRILFAGVLPEWRSRGIGTQLMHRAINTAQEQGWQTLSIGPLIPDAIGAQFAAKFGATPQQTYGLYEMEL